MIARRGPVRVDYGPCPGRVGGLDAVESMALRTEVYVAPVERRYLSARELAAIHEQPPEPPVRVMPLPTRIVIDHRAAGLRGAAATKKVHAVRRTRAESLAKARESAWLGRSHRTKVTEPVLLAAIRSARGNQALAASMVGLTSGSLRERVRTLRRHGELPEDVAALLRPVGGWRAA